MKLERPSKAARTLPKAPTGIVGLDDITGGGLPKGRPTLVCGGPGCGKSLFAMEFLFRGATELGEPGALITFEETAEEIAQNVRSLGFDLDQMVESNMIAVDHVRVEPTEIAEAGEYDLEGLFLRLGLAVDSVGAKRIVLDTIESLFGGFTNEALLRSELRRLFRWVKDRGLTCVITGERGEGALTRQGLEEYVSDCVILLDHRVRDQVSTRRLRIVKYRGSSHGADEYPFLIDEHGISVLPITSVGLDHPASEERISSGIPRLDAMLGGAGYFRGSSILVSGTAGTGKSSMAASFADATCRRGERCLYLAFEESPNQILRNMRSIGIDLAQWVKKGLLKIVASRPGTHGLETHLVLLQRMVRDFEPKVVIIDPISNFTNVSNELDAQAMLVRLIDFLKMRGVTALLTNLTSGGESWERTDLGVSSIIDTWILLRDIELGGERNRGIYVLKSRGMKHSNQLREYLISSQGIEILDVYVGPEGVLTGSMRAAQEAREKAAAVARAVEIKRNERDLGRRRMVLEAQIVALQAELQGVEDEGGIGRSEDTAREQRIEQDQKEAAARRGADAPASHKRRGK